MKNIVKKISATAMAFTLLGTSTVLTKSTSAKSNKTLVASAASSYNSSCRHSTWTLYSGNWIINICWKCGREFGRSYAPQPIAIPNKNPYSTPFGG